MIGLDTLKIKPKHSLPKYSPYKDKYIYTSTTKDLDKIISFSEEERTKNNDRLELAANANKLMKTTADNQNLQNINKANALKKYIEANDIYFSNRKNHVNDNINPKADYYKKFEYYLKLANTYYADFQKINEASTKIQLAKAADTLTIANDQLITANQYLENAFNIKIGLDTFPVTPKHKITVHQKNTTGKNKTTSTNNKNNTTNNKNKNKQNTDKKISGLYWYSAQQRTPLKASTPSGTIYRVQVGTSKYLLPVNELKDFNKIYYETLTNSQYKRFLVGDYSDLNNALQALSNLKSKGYKDAYIVKYVNGKRTGAKYTSTYVPQQNTTNTYYNAKDITKTKYLIYAVQIGTFSSPKTSADLKNLKPLYYKKLSDGRIQYFVAPYYKYDDAKSKLTIVKQKGFSDAIIVAYNNGLATSIDNAKKIEQAVSTNSKVIFRVQIGAFSDYLSSQQIEQNFGKISDIFTIHTHQKNGLIIYSAGDAKTFDEAKKIKQIIDNLGYEGCYIIAFKGDKQVPVSSVK